MFDFHDPNNPLLVLIGIIVAQLFLYGRKVKDRVAIAISDVVSDIMQFSVMFIVCMGFLAFGQSVVGWNLKDPWQLVTVVILFNMSFDTWFNRLRETFNSKVGAAFDVLLGRKIAVDEDALRGTNLTEDRIARVYPPIVDHAMDDVVARLDNVDKKPDNEHR